MARSKVKVWFDEEEDILYASFKEGVAVDSKEIGKDIRIEYGREGEIVGVEIHNLTKMIVKSLAPKLKKALKSI